MSQTITNGQSVRLSLSAGQSIAISSISGTYTASVVDGAAKGTVLATNSTGGSTYGPYATGAVIVLAASADGVIDYDVGVTPVNAYDANLKGVYDANGDLIGLRTPAGGSVGVGGKKQVGLIIFGQSNERGQAELVNSSAINQMTANPQAFRSLINPNITAYFPGVNQLTNLAADGRLYPQGSPWCKVYDDLWEAGYEALIYNASVGSLSFFTDAVSFPRARANSGNYFREARPAGTYGLTDIGCQGTSTIQNNYLFECTTGSEIIAVLRNTGPKLRNPEGDPIPDTLDYLLSPTLSKKLTAVSAPDFTAATALGSTVTDGAVVWTNRGLASTFGYTLNNAFKPVTLLGGVNAPGFDPFGLVRRATMVAQDMRARGVQKIIVYLCNGQSDAGATSQANYTIALQYLTQYCRSQGFDVCIGLSTYTQGDSTVGWDALAAARTAAVASFSADAGVHDGADLYTLMGTVPGANGLSYITMDNTANNNAHIDAAAQIVAGGHHAAAILAALA